jgi:hypothetical protein
MQLSKGMAMSKKSITTTPNELGSGNLPSGYDEVIFTLSNGNWIKKLTLPLQANDKGGVIIRSSASFAAELDVTTVDTPISSLTLSKDDEYQFEYSQATRQWSISGPGVVRLTPRDVGAAIPAGANAVTFYSLENADWVEQVRLPATAIDQAYIVVRSQATYSSAVSSDNMLYAGTTHVATGDEYVFKFLKSFNRWVVDSAPSRVLQGNGIESQMAPPTSPRTSVQFSDTGWIGRIRLPELAGDRDRVSLSSSAAKPVEIDPSNISMCGVMRVHAGDRYDFFYIAEKKAWQLIAFPDTILQAKDIVNGKLSGLSRPRTIINVSNGNWQSTLTLPSAQQEGSRAIVKSDADIDFNVFADNTSYAITKGEIAAFKVDVDKMWIRETVTIDLLLVYSDKAAARLGDDTMRNRMIEGFNLTNEALENSGANFRFRMRDLKKIVAKDNWKIIGDPLDELRSDPVVQGWRDSLKADGVYYEGTEKGGGVGYLRPNASFMISASSIDLDVTAMRHELGHNMGVRNNEDGDSFNKGYLLLRTVMAGNKIPYFSTPHRYTSDYGIPMGIPDKNDAVRAMNEFSATVAAYR